MANNLKKFTTEAEYTAATLNYPAVSWVTSGDTVHFDKTAPAPVNDKVMMAWTTYMDDDGKDIVLFNGGISGAETAITSVTLNDVDVTSTAIANSGVLHNYTVGNTDYLSKIGIVDTVIGDYFGGDLGGGFGSAPQAVDFLIPAQITEVNHVPTDVCRLVIEATTPPTTELGTSGFDVLEGIYVPDSSVSAYQTAWASFVGYIKPISQYGGNLPV